MASDLASVTGMARREMSSTAARGVAPSLMASGRREEHVYDYGNSRVGGSRKQSAFQRTTNRVQLLLNELQMCNSRQRETELVEELRKLGFDKQGEVLPLRLAFAPDNNFKSSDQRFLAILKERKTTNKAKVIHQCRNALFQLGCDDEGYLLTIDDDEDDPPSKFKSISNLNVQINFGKNIRSRRIFIVVHLRYSLRKRAEIWFNSRQLMPHFCCPIWTTNQPQPSHALSTTIPATFEKPISRRM
jgi:hypothetical protein